MNGWRMERGVAYVTSTIIKQRWKLLETFSNLISVSSCIHLVWSRFSLCPFLRLRGKYSLHIQVCFLVVFAYSERKARDVLKVFIILFHPVSFVCHHSSSPLECKFLRWHATATWNCIHLPKDNYKRISSRSNKYISK